MQHWGTGMNRTNSWEGESVPSPGKHIILSQPLQQPWHTLKAMEETDLLSLKSTAVDREPAYCGSKTADVRCCSSCTHTHTRAFAEVVGLPVLSGRGRKRESEKETDCKRPLLALTYRRVDSTTWYLNFRRGVG